MTQLMIYARKLMVTGMKQSIKYDTYDQYCHKNQLRRAYLVQSVISKQKDMKLN